MTDSPLSLDLPKLESVTTYIKGFGVNSTFRWPHHVVLEGSDCHS